MIMSNGIDIRQNEDKSIAMLAAQRQLYRDAKHYACFVTLIAILLPVIITILLLYFPCYQALRDILCIVSVLSLFICFIIDSKIEAKKELAAYIQLKFDVYVYQMPWNRYFFGDNKNIDCDIAEHSKNILADEKGKLDLMNWYTLPIATKPIIDGILSCQRENFYWDYKLRDRTKFFGNCIVVLLLLLIFGVGLWNHEEIIQVFQRIVYVLPLFKWAYDLNTNLERDMERLKKIDGKINLNVPKGMYILQDIQRELTEHRKLCYTIPDFIYEHYKDNDEDKAHRIASM